MTSVHREGIAAGVPYLAYPPTDPVPPARLLLAWHGFDEPNSEEAMHQALPLDDLNVWRVYLGLPMCGSRQPEGGMEEFMRLGYEDALLNLYGPIITQAVAELPDVVTALKGELGAADSPIALVGFSAGGCAVILALAESEVPVAAAAGLSATLDMERTISANEKAFGMRYAWSDESRQLARRLSAKDRAADIVSRHPLTALLLTAGDEDPIVGPEQLAETASVLRSHGFPEAQVVTGVLPGEGHQVGPEINGLLTGWMSQQLL